MAQAMTHADAASTQAVERYLLGELSSEERDQFEAHAFDCIICADDLKAAALFLDTGRAVLREEPPPQMPSSVPTLTSVGTTAAATAEADLRGRRGRRGRRGWRAWLAGLTPSWSRVPFASSAFAPAFCAAFLVLLGFSLYQNVVTLPAMRNSSSPRALSAFSFVSSGTRGATPLVIAAPARQPFLLFFDIPPGGRYASYHCAIVAADRSSSPIAVDVSADQARDTVQLFVPAGRISPGAYTLVITAGAQAATQEIARYPFVLQGRD
jgi:hypothetical protein